MPLAAIEWSKVGELVWVAPIAGIAVTIAYALMILGVSRAGEARRAGLGGSAMAFTALAAVSGLAFAAVVIFGVAVIINK